MTLFCQLLGTFGYRVAAPFQPGPSFKAGGEVLRYLITYPQPVAAETLATRFSPDAEVGVALHRLEVAVAGARRALREVLPGGDVIHCSRRRFFLDSALHLETDLAALEACARVGTPESARLGLAYIGNYCADDQAEWMFPQRARVALFRTRMLECLVEHAKTIEDYEVLISHGLRLIEEDPANEADVRIVMRAYDALGQRPWALSCYTALARFLEANLNVPPSPETQAVRASIVGRQSPPAHFG